MRKIDRIFKLVYGNEQTFQKSVIAYVKIYLIKPK